MTASKILLDPVDFMALHLSALEFGGIGVDYTHDDSRNNIVTSEFANAHNPCCKLGHTYGLDSTGKLDHRVTKAGLDAIRQDTVLKHKGGHYFGGPKAPFRRYIKLLNIDIKEAAA